MNDDIACGPGLADRFLVPVVLTVNYQVTVTFTRRGAPDAVFMTIPVGQRNCQISIDAYFGKSSGVDVVGGKEVREHPQPLVTNDIKHTLRITVTQQGDNVGIISTIDDVQFVSWQGPESSLPMNSYVAVAGLHAIGFGKWNTTVEVHSMELRLNKGGRGYRLGDDWKNPLMNVTDRPSKEVARAFPSLRDLNGKKYLISDKPLSLPDARLLATRVKGRLLTISSKEEEDFIFQQGGGLALWMSGWCAVDRKWRDERNRPLRYQGKWSVIDGRVQPDNWYGDQIQLVIHTQDGLNWDPGWDDVPTAIGGVHACIEWGEEYPDGP